MAGGLFVEQTDSLEMYVQRELTNRVGVQESHGVEKLLHTLNGRKTELPQRVFHRFAAPDQLGVHSLEKTRGTALEN